MSNFVKKYRRTITFSIFIILIVVGIFIYRFIRLNQGEYMPKGDRVVREVYNYKDNEYNVITPEKETIYRSYYREFINNMLYNPERAWDLLSSNTKSNMFGNKYEEFTKFIKKLDKKVLMTSDINRYSDKETNKITIVDTTESTYIIETLGVWNYTVTIGGRLN